MPNSNNGSIKPPNHYLHELPQVEEERLESLFKRIDLDGNGRIDILDLTQALHDTGVHQGYAQKFIEQSDQNKSGDVSLAEFIHYVREHEKKLRLQFHSLDINKDGKIDLDEMVTAFKHLGIEIHRNEAKKLLQRMDTDGTLDISYEEWRNYLLYAPSTDIRDIINYWRHSTKLLDKSN